MSGIRVDIQVRRQPSPPRPPMRWDHRLNHALSGCALFAVYTATACFWLGVLFIVVSAWWNS